jgi:hypothetical protein
MKGRKLKYFKEYCQRLDLYAKANGITICYTSDQDSEGEWIPRSRKINLDPDQDESSFICTVLHELGHALDDMALEAHKFKRLTQIYSGFYEGQATPKQIKEVVECEIRAWNLGRSVAKALKIRLGAWYDKEQQYYIKDYRSHIRKK